MRDEKFAENAVVQLTAKAELQEVIIKFLVLAIFEITSWVQAISFGFTIGQFMKALATMILIAVCLFGCDENGEIRHENSKISNEAPTYTTINGSAQGIVETTDGGWLLATFNSVTKIDKSGDVVSVRGHSYDLQGLGGGWFVFDLLKTKSNRIFIIEGINLWAPYGYAGSILVMTELDNISGGQIARNSVYVSTADFKFGSPHNGFWTYWFGARLSDEYDEKILVPLFLEEECLMSLIDLNTFSNQIVNDFTNLGHSITAYTFDLQGNYIGVYRSNTTPYYPISFRTFSPYGVLIDEGTYQIYNDGGIKALRYTNQGFFGLSDYGFYNLNYFTGKIDAANRQIFSNGDFFLGFEIFENDLILVRQNKSTKNNVCFEWYDVRTFQLIKSKCLTISAEEPMWIKGIFKVDQSSLVICMVDQYLGRTHWLKFEH